MDGLSAEKASPVETDSYLRENPELRLPITEEQLLALPGRCPQFRVEEGAPLGDHRTLIVKSADQVHDIWYVQCIISKDTGALYLKRTHALKASATGSYMTRLLLIITGQSDAIELQPIVKGRRLFAIDFPVSQRWRDEGLTGSAQIEIREGTSPEGALEVWATSEKTKNYTLLNEKLPALHDDVPVRFCQTPEEASRVAAQLQMLLQNNA